MDYPNAFISIAASSQPSPLSLAVHLQVTKPGDASTAELDAPVIAPGMLISQLCVQVGEPSAAPPYIDGKSRAMLFGYAVVIDIVGLPVPWRIILVGIGFVWSTPEIEYAPTTACVGPFIVTMISPVPVGFVRYQNSAYWL